MQTEPTINVCTTLVTDGECYEMDKTSISMLEILEPGGLALG